MIGPLRHTPFAPAQDVPRAARSILRRDWALLALIFAAFGGDAVRAQSEPPGESTVMRTQDLTVKQTPLRYDEDWSTLRNYDSATLPSWTNWKYQPLSSDGNIWLSTGVEARLRYEGYRNNAWGSLETANDDPSWFRVMPHLDLHAGPLRVFAQGILGVPISMQATPGPADKTGVDLLQGFGEAVLPIGSADVRLRGGRSLVSLGTERLVGTRYGPNIPQPFDGAHLIGDVGPLRVQWFSLRPVDIGEDSFDDKRSDTVKLNGAYLTYQWPNVGLDAYFLDYRNDSAQFNQGIAQEHRRTYGLRFFGNADRLSWNWEAMLQDGRFGRSDITAWMIGTETSYNVEPFTFRLRANIASGDRDADAPSLQTFNPMFPKGKYYGELSPIGPYNMINLHPSIDVALGHNVTLGFAAMAYWRQSVGDGVYGLPGNLIRASHGSTARFVGHQEEVVLSWQPTPLLSFSASYSVFTPGKFIRDTGPAKTIHMVGLEAMFRF